MNGLSALRERALPGHAFLGLVHPVAHTLGKTFHAAHGRANALRLPHVIRYHGTVSAPSMSRAPGAGSRPRSRRRAWTSRPSWRPCRRRP
nr:iron-containing alcohol dehydrogenase [Streptomyces sp. NRRL F-2747]